MASAGPGADALTSQGPRHLQQENNGQEAGEPSALTVLRRALAHSSTSSINERRTITRSGMMLLCDKRVGTSQEKYVYWIIRFACRSCRGIAAFAGQLAHAEASTSTS